MGRLIAIENIRGLIAQQSSWRLEILPQDISWRLEILRNLEKKYVWYNKVGVTIIIIL